MKDGFHYLYVEDDPLSREIMQTLLVDLMDVASLVIFEDSRDFLSKLRALNPRPDFALLDINVLPHNGYALVDMIRSDPQTRDIKVMAVTASVMSNEIDLMKRSGFDGALAKPLDMAIFPEIVRRLEIGEAIWQTN
ncbi:MAG: response regulator [Chloroflexota bacterium]